MTPGITGNTLTRGHLVKKENVVPKATQKVPSQGDMRKGKISPKRDNPGTRRTTITLTVITEKKRKIPIGTERPVIEIPIGRDMNKKIN